MTEHVRVRFAPSPTGALHIGGGHTALFLALGKTHWRNLCPSLEDTDRQRSNLGYERTIMSGCNGSAWIGMKAPIAAVILAPTAIGTAGNLSCLCGTSF